jgi:hypothetical protein
MVYMLIFMNILGGTVTAGILRCTVIQFSCSRPTNQIAVFSRLNWFTFCKCPQCVYLGLPSKFVSVGEDTAGDR